MSKIRIHSPAFLVLTFCYTRPSNTNCPIISLHLNVFNFFLYTYRKLFDQCCIILHSHKFLSENNTGCNMQNLKIVTSETTWPIFRVYFHWVIFKTYEGQKFYILQHFNLSNFFYFSEISSLNLFNFLKLYYTS